MSKPDVLREIQEIKARGGGTASIDKLAELWSQQQSRHAPVADFFLIRMVTIIEVFTRRWLATLIDHGDPYLENASRLGDLKAFNFNIVRALAGEKVTIGEVLSHTVSVNRIADVHGLLTTVLGDDLWSAIRSTYDRHAVELDGRPEQPIIRDETAMRSALAKLFEVRHILVHELPRESPYAQTDIAECLKATKEFTRAVEQTLTNRIYGNYPLTTLEMTEAANQQEIEAGDLLSDIASNIEQDLGEHPSAEFFRKSQVAWQTYCDAQAELHACMYRGGSLELLRDRQERASVILERAKRLRAWVDRGLQ